MILNNEEKHSILVIDDEENITEFLDLLLTKEGYNVKIASTIPQSLIELEKMDFSLAFLDINMPDVSGLESIEKIKEIRPNIEIIVMTAFSSTENAVTAIKKGAYDYISKPFKIDNLILNTKKAIERRKISKSSPGQTNAGSIKSNEIIYKSFDMIGNSSPMLMLYEMIKIVSQTTSNVLITGESGTGKELVAKAIHFNSDLKNKPFVTINCGAIPENLIESEMFGHKKGSFTGAIADKIGLFEAADTGTIFLDEVGELPIHLQVKLLRAIQERTIRRVGDNYDININVRVIAATNKDLQVQIVKGLFREDLYYRLNVIQLLAPPLKERGDDVILLSKHFFYLYTKKLNKTLTDITQEALITPRNYQFPGNVRELENIIERAVALCTDSKIKISDLPPHLLSFYSGANANLKPENVNSKIIQNYAHKMPSSIPDTGIELEKIISDIEIDIIKKALDKTGGVKKRAAKLLGITFRSMRYRLEKYEMD